MSNSAGAILGKLCPVLHLAALGRLIGLYQTRRPHQRGLLPQVILPSTNISSPLDLPPIHPSGQGQSKQSSSPPQSPSDSLQIGYDVFISYNAMDRAWVWGELLPKLEAAGLRVLDRFRDFEPGAVELTEVVRAVKNSRKTLLVLTPDWLQSDANLYEVHLTQYVEQQELKRKIVPLKLKPCSLPETLPFLVAVDFTDLRFREDEYKRLIRAIRETPHWWPHTFPPVNRKTAENSRNALLFSLLALIIILVLPGAINAVNELWPAGPLAFIGPAPTFTPTMTATPTPTATSTATPTATITPMPTMGSGFNIAVAEFAVTGQAASPDLVKDSQELSQWLFTAAKKENDQLPSALRSEIRGPGEIGVVGPANAAQVAGQHHATLLIYGVITPGADSYYVQPNFYVSEEGFSYAPEVAGPNRLGLPVPFKLPLGEPGTLFGLNEKLDARVQALRHLMAGLAYFYVHQDDLAYAEFEQAAQVDHWQPTEGQEVVYLLMGAAKLRTANNLNGEPTQRAEAIIQAEKAFTQAFQLNSNYARSYLGLGGIALTQAMSINEQGVVTQVDPVKLVEARDWYSKSMSAGDQPTLAYYIPIKAYYGLGQVQLAGYKFKLPGWSDVEARLAFNQVIVRWHNEAHQASELAWFVGHAHYNLGLLAGWAEDWDTVISECHNAHKILQQIEINRPLEPILYCYDGLALAYEKKNQLAEACQAYSQAIQMSERVTIPGGDRKRWQTALDQLRQKGACP